MVQDDSCTSQRRKRYIETTLAKRKRKKEQKMFRIGESNPSLLRSESNEGFERQKCYRYTNSDEIFSV
jgi:hypothetical protein